MRRQDKNVSSSLHPVGLFGRLGRRIALALVLLFALFPIAWTVLTSVRPEQDVVTGALLPLRLTAENYTAVWGQADLPRLMLNSLTVTALTVLLSLVLAIFAAYSISRATFRGRGAVMLLFLTIRTIPTVLLLIPLYVILQQLRLLDTPLGLAVTYTTFTLPAAVWFMKGFFDALPPALEDAARVDGCSRFGALARVMLPLVRPGVAATAILVAIESWNEFLYALLLTSSSRSRTWPVGLHQMIGEFQLPWGQLTAAAVLSMAPVIVAYAFAGRTLVSGLMSGGVKE